MAFTPRYTQPSTSDPYYSTYDRFYWLNISPYGGNCTGYAYGRFNECAERSLYNDFYITGYGGDTNARYWIYNTWPDQTHTSGGIDLELGDIIVWGSASGAGHVEVIEAIASDRSTITVSYSLWASTYGKSMTFNVRTIPYPNWSSTMGTLTCNDSSTVTYSNPFVGYIHNKYIEPTPVVTTRSWWKYMPLLLRRKKQQKGQIKYV